MSLMADHWLDFIWLAGWIVSIYPLAQWINAKIFDDVADDRAAKFVAGFVAVVVGCLWPLGLLMALAYGVSKWLWSEISPQKHRSAETQSEDRA